MNAQTYIFQQSKRDSLYSCGTAGLPAVQPVVARLPKGADDRRDFQESEKKREREREQRQGERKIARSPFDIYFFPLLYFLSSFWMNFRLQPAALILVLSLSLSLSFFFEAPISLRFLIRPIFSGWFAC